MIDKRNSAFGVWSYTHQASSNSWRNLISTPSPSYKSRVKHRFFCHLFTFSLLRNSNAITATLPHHLSSQICFLSAWKERASHGGRSQTAFSRQLQSDHAVRLLGITSIGYSCTIRAPCSRHFGYDKARYGNYRDFDPTRLVLIRDTYGVERADTFSSNTYIWDCHLKKNCCDGKFHHDVDFSRIFCPKNNNNEIKPWCRLFPEWDGTWAVSYCNALD